MVSPKIEYIHQLWQIPQEKAWEVKTRLYFVMGQSENIPTKWLKLEMKRIDKGDKRLPKFDKRKRP